MGRLTGFLCHEKNTPSDQRIPDQSWWWGSKVLRLEMVVFSVMDVHSEYTLPIITSFCFWDYRGELRFFVA